MMKIKTRYHAGQSSYQFFEKGSCVFVATGSGIGITSRRAKDFLRDHGSSFLQRLHFQLAIISLWCKKYLV